MKINKKHTRIGLVFLISSLFLTAPTRADFFGGDVVVLTQLLANALQQLAQLRQILNTGQQSLDFVKQLNQGIHDSLRLIETMSPNRDPGLYRGWKQAKDALRELQNVYGQVVVSPESQVQRDADQSVAEAVALNNSLYDYTREIDQVGSQIENYSHAVSPVGAQKLTAQSLGVIVHVMNASLRAQATALKLQAQTLAIQNRKEKESTRHLLDTTSQLSTSMKNQDTRFVMPRF